jgi:hypothetical protein
MAASADVLTGTISKSIKSSHLVVHSLRSASLSAYITWKQRRNPRSTQLETYRTPSGAIRPRSRKRRYTSGAFPDWKFSITMNIIAHAPLLTRNCGSRAQCLVGATAGSRARGRLPSRRLPVRCNAWPRGARARRAPVAVPEAESPRRIHEPASHSTDLLPRILRGQREGLPGRAAAPRSPPRSPWRKRSRGSTPCAGSSVHRAGGLGRLPFPHGEGRAGFSANGFSLYAADPPGGMVRYRHSAPRNAFARKTIWPTW